ncbi:carboxymuconolactone decarboxylase family protein [Paenibacillus methanolicus]|uniref:AhpD family alkylhydroperoxidase n=1 Tax=Paenibacillus methanolicus TaxID=582686 RepID=A0A5S5BP47_9BACL|nr:AhpD family alkylhydroperoxidase [Paenibacillus methanolicus]
MTKRHALHTASYSQMKDFHERIEAETSLDKTLIELIKIRASQLNGCAFCLDMHAKDARALGETEQRLYTLSAWRETPFFTQREQAALALTEAVTRIGDHHIPEEVYAEAARHFEPAQLSEVLMAIIAINAWNRIAITTGMTPR